MDADTFVDEASGLTMRVDRYYILSDSGSSYTSEGFASVEDARRWWAGHGAAQWPGVDLVVPRYKQEEAGFDDVDEANIFLGADLRHLQESLMAERPWQRDDAATQDWLELGGSKLATPSVIAGWTDEQCRQAEEWASAVYFRASDNPNVRIPPIPPHVAALPDCAD